MWIKSLAIMIIALLCLLVPWGCAPSLRQNEVESRGSLVRFVYVNPKAQSVCVSGSFNHWSDESHCLRRDGSTWSLVLSLPEGRYTYGFVIDGNTWEADPGATLSEGDGFGKTNSVLTVE
ncbi:MAG TPA: hypothetical protein DCE18_18180 [Syntrophobacteraceae bacterium]|nr:hypothetical protein [Syntrophobacteraceae bacterium]